ncbi:MAG TPA: thioredoxin domain-containing protein [Solirubrobacterales bacterium]|jgi:protein-disulfide isomerase|nr:thioredoxin domain-containing protein [Solirubrobacterales bacterium]
MSNQRDREKRREERIEAESKAQGADRRTRLLQLSAGGVFLAIIVVVVVIIVASGSSSSGGDASNVEHSKEVAKIVEGIPQQKLVLGKATAPTTLIMYGDLQCPICKEYVEEIMPEIISTDVKSGKVKLVYRDFIIISEESIPAGEAALAAGEQGKGWTFIETFYRNQGEERSGYVTEEFLESIGKASGIPDMAKWNKERKSGKFTKQVEATTGQAEKLGFEGTPSYAIEGPHSNGLELIGTPQSQGALEEAIKEAS